MPWRLVRDWIPRSDAYARMTASKRRQLSRGEGRTETREGEAGADAGARMQTRRTGAGGEEEGEATAAV